MKVFNESEQNVMLNKKIDELTSAMISLVTEFNKLVYLQTCLIKALVYLSREDEDD